MSDIDEACRDVVTSVDGGIACVVVDLESGLLLGAHVSGAYPAGIGDIVASAAMELFRGTHVGRIEQVVRSRRTPDEARDPGLQEVHATSRDSFHFAKTIKGGRAAIVVVTRKTANQGMVSAQMHAAIPKIESKLP
jgi:hypothetical protein